MNPSELPQVPVSVLIRVRNEEHALRRLFECLRNQKLDRPFEIVVIDNESDDQSAEVARAMGARVFTLSRELFSYGRAINVGVRLCHGDLIVLLSAHSWPQGDDWLGRMVDGVERENVAAAYCRQVADRKICRQEEETYFSMFAEYDYTLETDSLLQRCRSGADVYEICSFSNSAAIFRREVVVRFPFRNLPFAEDRAFVLDSVMAGHSIAYLGTASVAYHQLATCGMFYRIGWASQISKQLIRELGSKAIGTDLRRSELGRKFARLLYNPLEIIRRGIEALLHDKSQFVRSIRYATASCAKSLGNVVGELIWRSYRGTLGCDSSVRITAEDSMASENAT